MTPPPLATLSGGVLTLNNLYHNFTVTRGSAAGEVLVGSGGRVETFDGVSSLTFDDHAGTAADSIPVDSNVGLPAWFVGGAGDDERGPQGRDQLVHGSSVTIRQAPRGSSTEACQRPGGRSCSSVR